MPISKTSKNKYERCVAKVKSKQKNVNPYAICRASISGTTNWKGRKGRKRKTKKRMRLKNVKNVKNTKRKTKPKIFTGPRGGRYYIRNRRKVYI